MKKRFGTYNQQFKRIIWGASLVIFFLMIVRAKQAQDSTICNTLEVNIDYTQGNRFINKANVTDMIEAMLPGNDIYLAVKDIPLQTLENHLEENDYISDAEIYIDINGTMHVDIEQKHPVLRVINANNQGYYISDLGEKMPVSSRYAARVPIASGYIYDAGLTQGTLDSLVTKELFSLATYINKNEFLNALIEQIYVAKNGDFILSPKIGSHKIIFGNTNRMEEKFKHLQAFYKQGLSAVGWNKYKSINLKYKNQIVCKKK